MLDNPWTRLIQILLSRFIINLRQVNPSTAASTAGQFTSRYSTIAFRGSNVTIDDFVGNLGEPLDFVEYCVDDDDASDSSTQEDDMDPDIMQEGCSHAQLDQLEV
ncbi:hypothetical protein EIP86_005738 [Pleurotus ostreatoroseus]|nr:hypothetical protein EIP86_005738 [Pleurotus ostreatoroseus]